jgi:iron complex transport system substrate-binding protein
MGRSFRLILAVLAFTGCIRQGTEHAETGIKASADSGTRHARRFAIARFSGCTVVSLFGNRHNFDTTATFHLGDSGKCQSPSHGRIMKIPCNRIAALSCIYAGMIAETGAARNLVAIDNIDYVSNEEVIGLHAQGKLAELARLPEMDAEKTISLNPDIVFTFGMGEGPSPAEKKVMQAGVPVAVCLDHHESSPLARAEWIKFFAEFTGRRREADSIFSVVEKNYLRLRGLASASQNKPTVFNEIQQSSMRFSMAAHGICLGEAAILPG